MYPLFLDFFYTSPPKLLLINTRLRLVFKPTEDKESDVFQFFTMGQEVDHIKLHSSHTELVKYFENVSGIPAGAFGKLIWVSEYRSVNFE